MQGDDRHQILIVFLSLKVSVVLEPRGDTGAPDKGHDKHLIVGPLPCVRKMSK